MKLRRPAEALESYDRAVDLDPGDAAAFNNRGNALRQLERLELPGAAVVDLVDATGGGWAFHSALMIVSPLTLKRRWTKIEVIRLFNESDNARRVGAVYPEAYVPRRSLERIIAEIAALTTYTKPRTRNSRGLRRSPRLPGGGI